MCGVKGKTGVGTAMVKLGGNGRSVKAGYRREEGKGQVSAGSWLRRDAGLVLTAAQHLELMLFLSELTHHLTCTSLIGS